MELVIESTHLLAVRLHFWVVVVRGFHYLVDDELGVASNVEASNSKLDGDLQTVNKGLVLCNIVGCGKMYPDDVPYMNAQGQDEQQAGPNSRLHERPVKIHRLYLRLDLSRGKLGVCPFRDEIHQGL